MTEAPTDGEPPERDAPANEPAEAPTEAAATEAPPEQAQPTTKEVTRELQKSADERKVTSTARSRTALRRGGGSRIEATSKRRSQLARRSPTSCI